MKKLYEKNEILFAIFWIVVYTVSMGNLRNLGDDSPWMTAGLLAISLLMFFFVRKNGLMEKYGLARWAGSCRAMLWLIPLWLVVSGNLWAGLRPHYTGGGLWFAAVSMALVGFAEELIFRGFLFRAMLKDGNEKTAVIVSAVTFGLGHIINLLTGHELAETLAQICFAIAVGFMLTLVFYKGGSLLPCILAHSLIDVFSVFSADASDLFTWITEAVLILVALGYSLYLSRLEPALIFRTSGQEG